uniref:Telomerase-binding protein EST1A n=3 Tax=Lygus hesperus TaxID=30085 RepID=A0A146MA06_LYGHE
MNDFDRNARRGKPQREIYKPGSGPLRKTGNSRDDECGDSPVVNQRGDALFRNGSNKPLNSSRSQEINRIADELKKITMGGKPNGNGESKNGSDFRRKPGSEIYVPKPVAELRKNQQSPAIKPLMDGSELAKLDVRNENKEKSGRRRHDKKRKDRGGNRGGGGGENDRYGGNDYHEKSHSRESLVNHDYDSVDNRFLRHGSEPRSLPMYQENRSRDTRSVEPNTGGRTFAQERLHNKPPVGFQPKKSGFQPNRPVNPNLPPRLLRKTMAEKEAEAQANEMLPGGFRAPPPEWSRTLPNPPRGRGRGRLRQEDIDRFRRPLTPDRPDYRGSQDMYINNSEAPGGHSKNYNVEEKENCERDVPPEAHRSTPNLSNYCLPDQKADSGPSTPSGSTDVLDWAAEVEREEQEEIHRLSRANSKESVREVTKSHRKKKKKRKSNKERREERSVSRELAGNDQFRRGSVDNVSNHSRNTSRNNSIERNWREQRQFADAPRSRQSSYCDNRSRQSSPDHHYGNRSRKNSSCDNRSRQSSLDRKENSWRQRGGGFKEKRNDEPKNWRSEMTPPKDNKPAGILVLPSPIQNKSPPQLMHQVPARPPPLVATRRLYNPSNPEKPIMVTNSRSAQEIEQNYLDNCGGDHPMYMVPSGELLSSQTPLWYNPYKENFQQCHSPQIIRTIAQADFELQYLLSSGELLTYWEGMQQLRYTLKEALKILLVADLRFCEAENVEQHLWKILYYNVIELLRKQMSEGAEKKENFKLALLNIIDDGLDFYEKLLTDVENSNKIKLENFLNAPTAVREGLGYAGLALIAAQKIYLCLGDLARYKEQANETCNYGVSRQWYMKAHQINPKNGRPYNQLALLAMYTKRKLDAVYYYMRCLMSSNPMHNAREGLITLFDDNRKKFEAGDRRKKEERAQKEREKMKEKEGVSGFRREIWIHPAGGKNVHRTTSTCHQDVDSEEEELSKFSNVDLNKMFSTSYLHVHGKLYNKIGMESLTETAVQMLREFRALLQHSPLPLNSTRFLQLFSLNMFAIEVTQPKGDLNQNRDGVYRSAAQESALVVSLQMFNLLLERFITLLHEHLTNKEPKQLIPADCHVILPALKVWCDWMTTHVEVWNPPPSCLDYRVGPPGDCWNRIATLVTLLLRLNFPRDIIVDDAAPDHEPVYLPEDATLSGFTPLMANAPESAFVHKSNDMELAQMVHRLKKIEFFGQIILCGLDPPILKLHKKEDGDSEYISIVDIPGSQEDKSKCDIGGQSESEVCVESMSSSDESDDSGKATGVEEDDESVQSLLAKKGRLERQVRKHQARKNHFQKALMSEVLTEMEIRPHDLVPDTNCFINCLPQLESLMKLLPHPQHPYVIMVPLVVVNELEGLSRGCKPSQSALHSAMVRETAKAAMGLFQNRHPALRCVTTKGTVLNSSTFTLEEDSAVEMKNDDKILTTCVNLSKAHKRDEIKEGGRRKLYRDVVLLTEDRSLRLKAISKDMPVRALPDFIKWAGLG